MERISFVKMSGAGNDFIFIDDPKFIAQLPDAEKIEKLCDRRNGIGADGLITISNNPDYDFVMNYYNRDGSTGSLCGNGARCAIKYAFLFKNVPKENLKFLSNNIEYSGSVLNDDLIKFYFNSPKDIRTNIQVNAGRPLTVSYLDTGSPHVVLDIEQLNEDDINKVPVFELGRKLRYLDEFAPGGANVNFVHLQGDKVWIRTYERGVEDETLACGTGNVASAIICCLTKNINPPVHLMTRGGDELVVDFTREGQDYKSLSLQGPAKIIFTGEFTDKLFL
jgi:diaminopimelate epimerase